MTLIRERVVRGLLTGLVHEAAFVVISFGAMLVLVRLLTPADYGQAAVVGGVLALIRAFSGALFVEHAFQHGKDTEPDWSLYFSIVGFVQLTLFAVTNTIALAIRASDTMASAAPLLHVASIGLLLDWPAQVAVVKLRRELRFERLKLISGVALSVNLGSTIVLAWGGAGALALIIGGNVLSAAPMALSFLMLDRWRPRGRWIFVPARKQAEPVLVFARQQIGAGLLHSLRVAAESLVLTRAFGVATFGLLNRALALFQSTIGRVSVVFLDTAYPVLPLERNDRRRYAARASRFVEAALILCIPGAAFLVVEGASVSRVLYGATWIAADAYLAPAAVALASATLATAAGYVLTGLGEVRRAVTIEALVATGGLLALTATAVSSDPAQYMWVLAGTQVLVASVAFMMAAPVIDREWLRCGLLPAAAAAGAGVLGVGVVRGVGGLQNDIATLVICGAVYGAVVATVIAFTARSVVLEVMRTRKTVSWKPRLVTESEAKA
jgi:O-antigen/teichoic acid export membrane protein